MNPFKFNVEETQGKQQTYKKKFSYEFNKLKFPSSNNELFRGRLYSKNDSEYATLWLEERRSKNQWRCEIKCSCGPEGLPEEALIAVLRKALENIDYRSLDHKRSSDDPVLDMTEEVLILTLSMCGGVWRPEYKFPLIPIGVERLDVLEAKIRDLQDEIKELRSSTTVYLSLASNGSNEQQAINWTGFFPGRHLPEELSLSTNGDQIRVHMPGLYQVDARVCFSVVGKYVSPCLSLKRNEVAISQTTCTMIGDNPNPTLSGFGNATTAAGAATTTLGNTVNIHEILRLTKGDIIQFQHSSNASVHGGVLTNRLTILYLSA
mmetsp:Transcript_23994/g.35217  ORF Transcript_23994/g.35217 Transcript_23994/m.35217 type:complete len:320 (+) Transcript_23994:81-1040(+)